MFHRLYRNNQVVAVPRDFFFKPYSHRCLEPLQYSELTTLAFCEDLEYFREFCVFDFPSQSFDFFINLDGNQLTHCWVRLSAAHIYVQVSESIVPILCC